MGGRGASGGGRLAGGGLNAGDITGLEDLVSMREGKPREIDEVLSVGKDVHDKYGEDIDNLSAATLKESKSGVLGFFDGGGGIALNKRYLDSKKMDKVIDEAISDGYHPPRGKKTGLQSVAAHEYGHKLTEAAGRRHGKSLDAMADEIVKEARQTTGHRGVVKMASKISKYATVSNAEAVAEAFTDVYCNGGRAKRESIATVNALDKRFGL